MNYLLLDMLQQGRTKLSTQATGLGSLDLLRENPWTVLSRRLWLVLAISLTGFGDPAWGDQTEVSISHDHSGIRSDSHGPIGVMADHMHKSGEWMISYRFMRMWMEGNRIGTDSIDPNDIVTTISNRFANEIGQPPTLRVVPLRMYTDMHMFGTMYAPTSRVTFMAMGQYLYKDMDHVTFQGGTGTTIRGSFTTRAVGVGDTKLAALIKIYENMNHSIHLNAGVGIPTGSITKEDEVLKPNGIRSRERLPYSMQLGSGTKDLLPGLTYAGKLGQLGWGGQLSSVIRTSKNNEGYSLGDSHRITGWSSYMWRPWISTSIRMTAQYIGKIEGIDPAIVLPVQTADPDNQGGTRLDVHLGLNIAGQSNIGTAGHRLAFEIGAPVYQDLNGPQLETDWTLTLGYQYAF